MYMIPYNSLFDDFTSPFDEFWNSTESKTLNKTMQTDIKEIGDNYELIMDIPGVKKEDIKVELKNGYLNISAVSNKSVEEKDENQNYIRKERFSGSYSRSFYVGDKITTQDISGKFENGTLKLIFPKEKKQNTNSFIEIQ